MKAHATMVAAMLASLVRRQSAPAPPAGRGTGRTFRMLQRAMGHESRSPVFIFAASFREADWMARDVREKLAPELGGTRNRITRHPPLGDVVFTYPAAPWREMVRGFSEPVPVFIDHAMPSSPSFMGELAICEKRGIVAVLEAP